MLAAPSLRAHQLIASAEDLRRLSIEELAQIKITSVSKTEESVNRAAAAVYVITGDAIRRSGANSIPEILRLAPNLHVARLDANNYAISARGFNHNSATANKLLVLIDGRAVYSPLFSGTFWDAQRTVLQDIDRVEVISGPGGALWGANAVNGVINIITKPSDRTIGSHLDVRTGTLDHRIAARHGVRLSDSGSFRGHFLGMRHGSMERSDGSDVDDGWNHVQSGFRGDWRRGDDTYTIQGEVHRGSGIGRPGVRLSGEFEGGHLSGAWSRTLAGVGNLRIQSYAETARRILTSGIDSRVDQMAIDTQLNLAPRGRHTVVVGGGFRTTDDELVPGPNTVFLDPAQRRLRFGNVFAHDAIDLTEKLRMTVGVKLEHNTYTGIEAMPDARVSWAISNRTALWGAVGRAVRTPSRFDTDLVNRNVLRRNPDFGSEILTAYEAGYRGIIGSQISLSVSLFYNSYDRLRTLEASGPQVFPLVIRNNMRGNTSGLETWADVSLRSWWRVSAGLAFLDKDLELAPGSADIFGVQFAGNDPRTHWSLRSNTDLPGQIELDLWVRRSGALPGPVVEAYLEADARLTWMVSDTLALSLDGKNLLHERHREFVNPSIAASEIPRSFTLSARWTR